MQRNLRSRTGSGRCVTAGCERALPYLGAARCSVCEAAVRATPVAPSHIPSLFDPPPSPPPTTLRAALPESLAHPARGKTSTSARAAEALAPSYSTKRYLILTHIQSYGATGRTRGECASELGMKLSTATSAINTLMRQGLIGSNPDEERPDADSGLACAVLVSEEFVVRWQGTHRRARSSMFDTATGKAGCDLVHPRTGEPMSETEQARYLGMAAHERDL